MAALNVIKLGSTSTTRKTNGSTLRLFLLGMEDQLFTSFIQAEQLWMKEMMLI